MHTVIFSDLDGSLLDQDTYTYDAALPALRMVRDKRIPVVFVSSKTRAEIEVWRQRLSNHDPFVVENGGGVYIPKGYFPFVIPGSSEEGDYLLLSLGIPYATIRKKLAELRQRTHINVRGFGDMNAEEVAELTGLTLQEAELAKKRDFTEPFVFPDTADAQFLQLVEGERLRWTQGVFFHLMGDHHKGRAVDRLRSWYERKYDAPVTVIGIGDSLNDLPFLLAVDRPVLIRKKNGAYDDRIEIPGLIRTHEAGAAGWGEAVEELLKR